MAAMVNAGVVVATVAQSVQRGVRVLALTLASWWLAASPAWAEGLGLQACRLRGLPHEAQCGVLERPLDPEAPQGRTIDVHVAVLPALARNKHPDPIFFFAGGPGQSAIQLAGHVQSMLSRLGNRRDIVLVDQRGTGRSAALMCEPPDPWRPLAEALSEAKALDRLRRCARDLKALPHGDLRFYTTTIAIGDVEAVRAALGAPRINLVGVSYGTRAALEYQRQFPRRVRSMVLDGVAPPDMGLVRSMSVDNQVALGAVFRACQEDEACAKRFPSLKESWRSLLQLTPRSVDVRHPLSGKTETVALSRASIVSAVRAALYVPSMAAVLPAAIDAAASHGRFEPLLALSQALAAPNLRLAEGMHFAVVCSEDLESGAASDPPGQDFDGLRDFYVEICRDWPSAKVSDDFRKVVKSEVPSLLLSGGDDPATPPRHGQAVAGSLGEMAIHLVVPHAAHGVMGLPCVRDLVHRFIDEADQRRAASTAPSDHCARAMPRAGAYFMAEPSK